MDNEINANIPDDEMEFSADIITLTDEDGEEHIFELVDTLEKDGESYVALIAVAEDYEEAIYEDADLFIMKVIEEEGEEILEIVEDDDEFDSISEIFIDRLSDIYEFGEGDEE